MLHNSRYARVVTNYCRLLAVTVGYVIRLRWAHTGLYSLTNPFSSSLTFPAGQAGQSFTPPGLTSPAYILFLFLVRFFLWRWAFSVLLGSSAVFLLILVAVSFLFYYSDMWGVTVHSIGISLHIRHWLLVIHDPQVEQRGYFFGCFRCRLTIGVAEVFTCQRYPSCQWLFFGGLFSFLFGTCTRSSWRASISSLKASNFICRSRSSASNIGLWLSIQSRIFWRSGVIGRYGRRLFCKCVCNVYNMCVGDYVAAHHYSSSVEHVNSRGENLPRGEICPCTMRNSKVYDMEHISPLVWQVGI